VERQSLREALSDWRDWDGAGYTLGICLGLMPPEPGWGRAKHVFWSNHEIGNMLYAMLDQLVAAGVLEKRDEPDIQYRWNPAFRGSWETAE
jgi:hypothetical protein